MLEKKGNAGQLSFGRYIHLAIGSGDLRMCPGVSRHGGIVC